MCEQFSCHIYFLYFIAQIARNPSYSFLSVNKQINPRNKKTQECILSFLFASLTLLTYLHINHIKLITNRWAWALVSTKLVDPGNSLAWGGGIHGNPASGPHQVPSHWTIQWNTYRPNTYLAHTSRRREGWEKPKHKLTRKQQAIATTLCEELQASNCIYKSQGAPARGIGPPLL